MLGHMSGEQHRDREIERSSLERAQLGRDPHAFPDNFARVLGLHRLTATQASDLLGISVATLSAWLNGHRQPRLSSLSSVAQFFEINLEHLAYLAAPSLMDHELGSAGRFRSVEQKIRPDAYWLRQNEPM